MFLFPSIDLRDGQVVRLARGDYDQQTTYSTDTLTQARSYADAGATWLHLVDLDGARTGVMKHMDVLADICRRTPLKMEVGGGVRTTETIKQLLDVGVERVILGTAALKHWTWFRGLMDEQAYRGRIVLGLDARAGQLAVSGWEVAVESTALDIAAAVSDWPLAAIVYTDIARDGMLAGPNIEATEEIARSTKVPVVASGGVGTLDDLRALRQLPLQGAIVGRALYEDAFTIDEALTAFEGPAGG